MSVNRTQNTALGYIIVAHTNPVTVGRGNVMFSNTDLNEIVDFSNISQLSFDDGSGLVWFSTTDGYLRSWDPETGAIVNEFNAGGNLADFSFSIDGTGIYVAQRDTVNLGSGEFQATIHYVDLTGGGITDTNFSVFGLERGVFDIAITASGIGLFTTDFAGSASNPFRQINTAGNIIQQRTDLSLVRQSTFLTLSEDNRYILIQEFNVSNAPLHIYDSQLDAVIASTDSFELSAEGFGPLSGFNRGYAAISAAAGLVATVTNASPGFVVTDFDLNGVVDLSIYASIFDIGGVTFSSDGTRLYAMDLILHAIYVFDTTDWGIIDAIKLQTDFSNNIHSQPFGDISVSSDDRLILVDTQSGFEIADLHFAIPPVSSASNESDKLFGTSAGDLIDGLDGIDLIAGLGGHDTLLGNDGDDLLHGAAGNDSIFGGAGSDSITGGAGKDMLEGGFGGDTIDGGADIDTAIYSNATGPVSIDMSGARSSGNEANGDILLGIEIVEGSDFGDTFDGASADVMFKGAGGNDTLNGGLGADTLDGDIGADYLSGFGGDDLLTGGTGKDLLDGGDDDDTLEGGGGADTLDGGAGFDIASYASSGGRVDVGLWNGIGMRGAATGDRLSNIEGLIGSAQNDKLTGSVAANMLAGGAGGDRLWAGAGNDTLLGEEDNDLLKGQAGDDSLDGGDGDDTLDGGAGADALEGGAGFDTASYAKSGGGVQVDMSGGAGVGGDAAGDVLSGIEAVIGSAFGDTLAGFDARDQLAGGDGDDELHGNGAGDLMSGDAGNDTLTGGRGNDTLNGGADHDVLNGGKGKDVMDGGVGFDAASYAGSGGGVQVELWSGLGRIGEAKGDQLSGIEGLIGSDFNDKLVGDGSGNMLDGANGHDRLWASGGDDTLEGGNGNDLLKGQRGNDVMNGSAGRDTLDGALGDDIFQFGPGGGDDLFQSFTAGATTDDIIELLGFGSAFDTFAEVIAAATQVGADTVIDFGGGDMITLENVTLTNLHADDFLFN